MRQAVQVRVHQDAVDRRRRDTEPACELGWALTQAQAELDTAPDGGLAGLVR